MRVKRSAAALLFCPPCRVSPPPAPSRGGTEGGTTKGKETTKAARQGMAHPLLLLLALLVRRSRCVGGAARGEAH